MSECLVVGGTGCNLEALIPCIHVHFIWKEGS